MFLPISFPKLLHFHFFNQNLYHSTGYKLSFCYPILFMYYWKSINHCQRIIINIFLFHVFHPGFKKIYHPLIIHVEFGFNHICNFYAHSPLTLCYMVYKQMVAILDFQLKKKRVKFCKGPCSDHSL